MVGLVLVSHSHTLAQAAKELALGVNENVSIPVEACGGVGEDHEELGTDATEILAALEAVGSAEGILLLMDLGSAILSAEMAVDLFEEDIPVRLCPAPLVEGAVASAVQISLGANLDTVYQEALTALEPKLEQLGAPSVPETSREESDAGGQQWVQRRFTIRTAHGLHARPAAQFVRAVGASGAAAEAAHPERPDHWVNARSLNRLATLQIRGGEDVLIRAPRGPATEELFRTLTALVEENFGEVVSGAPGKPAVTAPSPPQEDGAGPISLSPGVVVAPAFKLERRVPQIPQSIVSDTAAEVSLLKGAIRTAAEAIEGARQETASRGAGQEAEIFEAHLLLLEDPEFIAEVEHLIVESKLNALAAVDQVTRRSAEEYRELDDPYMRARAQDVEEVGRRLLLALAGQESEVREPEVPSIILAEELGPAETVALKPSLVRGFVTSRGDRTSHAAILARALGVPAITGYPGVSEVKEGVTIVLDAGEGLLLADPSTEELARYEKLEEQWQQRINAERSAAGEAGRTADGIAVPVYANIGGSAEAPGAVENGAEGVGLFRTEFLFLGRAQAPDEQEQYGSFRGALEAMDRRPVTLRLLDIGGDKQIAYLDLPREDNPFLGVRGVRLYRKIPEIYRAHLRAALRAAAVGELKIMIPMVSRPEEVEEVRAQLLEAHRELRSQGVAHLPAPEVGVMIETPAAVELASELTEVSDFFSLGTNDLTQYLMAADRGNRGVADLQDGLNPAVLRAIYRVTGAARAKGVPCGVCGELAADPCGAMILTGLGATSLSVAPASIPSIKATLRRFTSDELRTLAQRVLGEKKSAAVRQRCQNLLDG